MQVRHWAFGSVVLEPGDVVVHDGGIHGVQGHSVERRGGAWSWQRRLDGFRPHGRAGEGSFVPDAAELAQLSSWLDALWEAAALEPPRRPPPGAPPRWVWIVAQRRGDELRALDGDSHASLEAAQPLLDWLVRRVDALSEA
jgi:hypothetical protein